MHPPSLKQLRGNPPYRGPEHPRQTTGVDLKQNPFIYQVFQNFRTGQHFQVALRMGHDGLQPHPKQAHHLPLVSRGKVIEGKFH